MPMLDPTYAVVAATVMNTLYMLLYLYHYSDRFADFVDGLFGKALEFEEL